MGVNGVIGFPSQPSAADFSSSAVSAMSAANITNPVLFRTYQGRSTSVNCFPLEALLATLADVESFPPVEIEAEKFISASFGHFNPSEELLREASSIFPSDAIATIVSIGSGRPPPTSVSGLEGLPHAVLEHAKDCQAASDRIGTRFSRYPELYMRFEVGTLSFDKQDHEIGSGPSGTIKAHSRAYLNRDEIRTRLNTLSCSLTDRPIRLKVSQLSGTNPGAIERIEEGMLFTILDKLEVSQDAPYNSAAARLLQRQTCTANTRVNILHEIISWAKDAKHPSLSSLFWVFGLAGTGKSTIAQSVCEFLQKEALLTSSYFCSIQLDSKDSKRIFPTIASHLATCFLVFAKHLVSALRDDPKRASSRISDQFRDLLCAPWSLFCKEVADRQPCVIVIDALDECDSGEEILRLILDAIDHNELQGIRFLATSRPVPRLVEIALKLNRGPQIALHEVKKEEVSRDIGLFLEEKLQGKISPADIRELTVRSDGLFIFASTLVKHLISTLDYMTTWEIQERLRQILEPRHQGEEVGLDTLYDHILRDALLLDKFGPEGFKVRLSILQTVVSMEQATTPRVISDFLGYDVEVVIGIVNGLHSVLFTRGSGEPIYVIHASFHDFVVSQAQGTFQCDPSSIQNRLAQSCLSWMQGNLKFNICNIESSFTTNDDLSTSLDSIGESLAYACRHWWAHLKGCPETVQKGMRPTICQMMEKKGIFWIEVMTLLGDERHCRDILTEIAVNPSMAPGLLGKLLSGVKRDSLNLQTLAFEAADMVSMFMSISPKMTSHLYVSVLPLWEGNNLECWKLLFRHLPHVLSRRVGDNRTAKSIFNVASGVHSVTFSPDGRHIISGSSDSTVRIWDAVTGKRFRQLDGHGDAVSSVAFSPNGKYIVSGSKDATVRIWNAVSGKQVWKLCGHAHAVNSISLSRDGERVISGSDDSSVRIWDVESGTQVRQLNGHGDAVNSAVFSPDGELVVSGSSDNSMLVWDAGSGRQLQRLDGSGDAVNSVAFSPDGKLVVSGSDDSSVRIWDVESGTQVRQLNGHGDTVKSVKFSCYGRHIVSGSSDNTVRVWDPETGKQLWTLSGHGDVANSVAFSPNGKHVVSGSYDNTVRVWDMESRKPLRKRGGHGDKVNCVAFSPDGKKVASGSGAMFGFKDNTLRIWDAKSGKQLWKLSGHAHAVNSVAFSPNGKLVVSGSSDNTVQVWDSVSGKRLQKFGGYGDAVNSVAFSPNSKLVVSGSKDSTIRIWDVKSGLELSTLGGHEDGVNSVVFSPDGKRVASGSTDQTVRIWDTESGNQLQRLGDHGSAVSSVAFSPDSKLVVSGSDDSTVHMWDAESSMQLWGLYDDGSGVNSVSFSPDGKSVASGSNNSILRIWDVASGNTLQVLQGHRDAVNSVAFSPDGKRIVSGSDDKTVRIWDSGMGTQLWKPGGHEYPDNWVAFSPEGERLWDLETLVRSVSFYSVSTLSMPYEEQFCELNLNIKHTSVQSLLSALLQSTVPNSYALYLNPTTNSCETCDDGWIVTLESQIGVKHRIIWLPPSLRPLALPILMGMPESGFNRIDLSGCVFGDGWANFLHP
ncbi:quinon protein alcohol dehydrogenase-like superfamily [Flagelloscypha sp. PMI_526]|nr:quinon protein alcohol dehydrogenase-like superfamily [Flagelloscypha sp. PMI_526]